MGRRLDDSDPPPPLAKNDKAAAPASHGPPPPLTVGRKNPSNCRSAKGRRRPLGDRHRQALRPKRACSRTTPGFTSTAEARKSQITYIDGDEGRAPVSGVPHRTNSPSTGISSRPATCSCTVSCRRRLRRADFDYRVTRHTMVHDQNEPFSFNGFRRDAPSNVP